MRSKAANTSVIVGIALVGTALAFLIGAQAGTVLNGRMVNISVARVPMPLLASPGGSPVTTHVR